jgi:hypothetical protein
MIERLIDVEVRLAKQNVMRDPSYHLETQSLSDLDHLDDGALLFHAFDIRVIDLMF